MSLSKLVAEALDRYLEDEDNKELISYYRLDKSETDDSKWWDWKMILLVQDQITLSQVISEAIDRYLESEDIREEIGYHKLENAR